MAGTAVFQSGTLATPGAGIVVATDAISGTQYQQVKLDIGPAGSSIPVAYGGTGLPLGTLPGGSVGIVGTLQALGTYQPLAGSVHPAAALPGTSHITGTVQPLAGSVHLASGTVQVLGTLQAHGTTQALGTVQPLAGSVHPAAPLPGTSHITGTVQATGTTQVLGTLQPLAGSVHVAAPISGTVQVHGTVPVGTIAGTVSVGTVARVVGTVSIGTIAGTVSVGTVAGGTVAAQAYGVYNTTLPTVTNGAQAQFQLSSRGELQINSADLVATGNITAADAVVPAPGGAGAFVSGASTNNSLVAIQCPGGDSAWNVQITGTLSGNFYFEGSADSTNGTNGNWIALNGRQTGVVNTVLSNSATGAGYYRGNTSGLAWFRVRNVGGSGPVAAIVIRISSGQGAIFLNASIPAGANLLGTVAPVGTTQALGTIQPLAGSVHVAAPITGTVQTHGTSQIIGTIQPLAGSVHLATNLAGGTVVAVGSALHGAAADARPLLIAAFGSSGTQAAVDDGDAVRLWADLNGRLQIRGTIDSMPAISVTQGTIPGGTIQLHGTSEVLGTVRALVTAIDVGTIAEGTINSFTGTAQVLGTLQPLAGSVHLASALPGTVAVGTVRAVLGTVETLGTHQPLAGSVHLATNLAGGTVVSVGSALHGAVADARPHLMGAFGSSGTQAAVDDGDAVRLWADLNGRLQVRGTIDSIPAITITAGTVSLQTGGTIHVGSVQRIAGTVEALGTFQPLAGSVHIANTIPGTADIGTIAGTVSVGTVGRVVGTVLVVPGGVAAEGRLGTMFTGAGATNGTLVPAPGAGTYVRLFDLIISGSTAGTAWVELGNGTLGPALFAATNGGLSLQSTRGIRTNGTNQDILFNYSAGTWYVFVNYVLELQP
jgi:hypothetical protein